MKDKILNPEGVKRFCKMLETSNDGFLQIVLESVKTIEEQRNDLILILNTFKVLKKSGFNVEQRNTDGVIISRDLDTLSSPDGKIYFTPSFDYFSAFTCASLNVDGGPEILINSLVKDIGAKGIQQIKKFSEDLKRYTTDNKDFIMSM